MDVLSDLEVESPAISVLFLAAGISSYVFYFKQSEHHYTPLNNIKVLLVVFLLTTYADIYTAHSHWTTAFAVAAYQISFYFLGALGSVTIFRLFFNSLKNIPGPYAYRLSKLVFSSQNSDHRAHVRLQALHRRYGRVVRLGPNDLSIADPDAVEVILGDESKCGKAAWYDQDAPLTSVLAVRDAAAHKARRAVWDQALDVKELSSYEGKITAVVDSLMSQILEHAGEPMNMSRWLVMFSFDVMAGVGFSKSTKKVETGIKEGAEDLALDCLVDAQSSQAMMYPPWTMRLMKAVPMLNAASNTFTKYTSQILAERGDRLKAIKEPDIMTFLMDAFAASANPTDELPGLRADARLLLGKGTETVASLLIFVLYYISKDRAIVSSLRKELDPVVAKVGAIDSARLSADKAPYLNGIVNEVLRLHPPIPSGVYRCTLVEGVRVGETLIPGHTTVQIPWFTMGRDEDVYPDSEKLLPERWYPKRNLIKRREAFTPFSIGSRSCPAQGLALLEVRLLITRLVTLFDFSIAESEDEDRLLAQTRDHFTMALPEVNFVFSPRKKR